MSCCSPRQFICVEDIVAAYRRQVTYMVKLTVEALDVLANVRTQFKPKPFISATTGDCLTRGRDLTWGGGH